MDTASRGSPRQPDSHQTFESNRSRSGADSPDGDPWRQEPTETVAGDGIETHYVRRGSGPPIVFVHGAVMDHRMWAPQLAALADEYNVVAYDVRGHGLTGGSDREEYTIDLYAEDLVAFVDALDLDRPVVVGLSMGGAVAQVVAARHPDSVAGVVLADTFTPGALGWTGRFIFAGHQLFALLAPVVSYKRLNRVQTWLARHLAPGAAGDAATIQRLIDEGPTIPPGEFRKVVGSYVGFMRSDFDPAAITVPTRVLYGEHEPAAVRQMCTYLGDRIPDATVTAIPDAGHASNIDNPAVFSQAVRTFAGEVVAAGD